MYVKCFENNKCIFYCYKFELKRIGGNGILCK